MKKSSTRSAELVLNYHMELDIDLGYSVLTVKVRITRDSRELHVMLYKVSHNLVIVYQIVLIYVVFHIQAV